MAGIQAEFSAPLRAGDKVEFRLWIEQFGWSSIRWAFEIMKDDSPAVKIAETLVFTQLQPDGTFKAMEITENYRRKMAPYVKDDDEPGLRFRS